MLDLAWQRFRFPDEGRCPGVRCLAHIAHLPRRYELIDHRRQRRRSEQCAGRRKLQSMCRPMPKAPASTACQFSPPPASIPHG